MKEKRTYLRLYDFVLMFREGKPGIGLFLEVTWSFQANKHIIKHFHFWWDFFKINYKKYKHYLFLRTSDGKWQCKYCRGLFLTPVHHKDSLCEKARSAEWIE